MTYPNFTPKISLCMIVKNEAENPYDYSSHYHLGVSYYVAGNLEKASSHFAQAKISATENNKNLSALFRNYAICLFDLGLYEKALNLLQEGLSYYPDYTDLYFIQGQIFFDLKLFSQAEIAFKKCLQFTKPNPNYISTQGAESFLAEEYLADIYATQKDWQKALNYQLRSLKSGPQNQRSIKRLNYFAAKTYNNGSQSKEILQQTIPYLSLEELLSVLLENCCSNFVLPLDLPPEHDLGNLYFQVAKFALARDNLTLAQKILLLALECHADWVEVSLLLGQTLINSGKTTEGLFFIEQAVKQEPDNPKNQHFLLKNMLTIFEDFTRKTLDAYPNLTTAQQHLCTLATFKNKLVKEGLS